MRGSQVLAASGYTPADMVGFFQTLERVDPSKKTNWLADHPAPPDRIARIQKEAQLLHVSETPTENVAELRKNVCQPIDELKGNKVLGFADMMIRRPASGPIGVQLTDDRYRPVGKQFLRLGHQ